MIKSYFLLVLFLSSITSQPQDLECPAGWYRTSTGCVGCDEGNYCPKGATKQLQCSSTFYSLKFASECKICPEGYFCSTPRNIKPCTPNSHCPVGSLQPSFCPANRACGRNQFVQCPERTYSLEGDGFCSPCPAGKYCPVSGQGTIDCPPGTWSPPSSAECTQCQNSYECPDPSSPPKLCRIGYRSNVLRTACVPCDAGFECSDPANPKPCGAKYYSERGATYCKLCPEGFECPDGKTKTPCTGNTYAYAGQEKCYDCPIGHHCTPTFSKRCPPGTYNENFESCKELPDGYYLNAQYQLDTCGPGFYLNDDRTQCYPCPSGHRCGGFVSLPERCPVGTIIQNNLCEPCPAGKACPHPNLPSHQCQPGYYLHTRGQFCTLCTRGYYCPGGGSGRIQCAKGSTSLEGATSCEFKELVGFKGEIVKVPITVGFYKNMPGDVVVCPVNHYCPISYEDPYTCPPGWFSFHGFWTCAPKQPGIFGAPSAFAVQSLTPEDNFEKGYDWARACPEGTNSFDGSGECSIIPANFEYDFSTNPPKSLKPCQPGWFSPVGQASCRPSPSGLYYQNGEFNHCPPNHYCLPATTVPVACPDGTYSHSGASTCYSCPGGYQCLDDGSLVICPKGTYSRQNESSCKPCSAGFLCYEGSNNPRNEWHSCPRGYYCPVDPNKNAVVLIPCPAQHFGISQRGIDIHSGCAQCPAGYVCPEAASHFKWYPCPPDHYCVRVARTPTPCPPGTSYPGVGAISEHQCKSIPEGYYITTEGITQICPPGHFCPRGTKEPIQCPEGYYNKEEGAPTYDACVRCPAGFVCTGGSITDKADPLFYIPYHGASRKNQWPVPPGSGWNEPGNALYYRVNQVRFYVSDLGGQMKWCENGQFVGKSGYTQLHCTPCQKGMDCRAGEAFICPKGKYCIQNDQIAVADCPPGTYGDEAGLVHKDQCTPCQAGKYCPGGGISQENCPLGFYCPPKAQYPQRCPDGTYGAQLNLDFVAACTLCPFHHFCRDGFKYECPLGTFQPYPGQSDCLVCPGGYYCDENGTKVKKLCPKGKFSAAGDMKGCQDCPRGFACNSEGIDYQNLPEKRCVNGRDCDRVGTSESTLVNSYGKYSLSGIIYLCPPGTYHYKLGATSVIDCMDVPPGFYANIEEFSNKSNTLYGILQECKPGYYCPQRSSEPIPCPRRTFNVRKFAKTLADCEECLAGSICDTEGLSTFKPCPEGYYCPRGTDRPERCPIGTYSPFPELKSVSECLKCLPGKYCSEKGSTDPIGDCYPGFLCTEGSPRPDPIGQPWGDYCSPGGYCPSGTPIKRNCPEGTYNPNPGGKSSADCISCPPGSYCTGQSPTPEPTGLCPGGYYCPQGTSDPYANPAPAGQYAPEGSSTPILCPIGTYSPNQGLAQCIICVNGDYCSRHGVTNPSDCPAGNYCLITEVSSRVISSLIPCPPGTYRPILRGSSLADCFECPPRKACPYYGMDINYPCSAGFYCRKGAKDPNPTFEDPDRNYGPCPAGHYCPAQTGQPNPCLPGFFLPYKGARSQNQCIQCLAGQYCSKGGLSNPEGPCFQGYYCPPGSVSPFQNKCQSGHYCPRASGQQKVCPDGYYQDQEGSYLCKICPSGHFCIQGVQRKCPKGRFCPGI